MSDINLLIVGSIGIDTIATPLERRAELLGGSVTYACAAASFDARPGMVGVVGDDFPETFLKRYARFGIDLAGLQNASGTTFRWEGEYEEDFINRRTLRTELGVFGDFLPELPQNYRNTPYVLLGNIGPALQLRVLDQMQAPRFVAADTMDLWINVARDPLEELIGRVNLLTLNDSEARLLTGHHHLRDCAEEILGMGPGQVIIKKGEHGSMLVSREGLFLAPAYPVPAVRDPTGAGDAFAGGMMGWIANQDCADEATLRQGIMRGSVLAAFSVEDFSFERLESLDAKQYTARLAEFREMTRWPTE